MGIDLVAEWIHFTLFGRMLPTIKLKVYTFGGLMNSATKFECVISPEGVLIASSPGRQEFRIEGLGFRLGFRGNLPKASTNYVEII